MHAADTTRTLQNVLLLVGYMDPGFVAIVAVDWIVRAGTRGGARSTGRRERRRAALVAFGHRVRRGVSPPRWRS